MAEEEAGKGKGLAAHDAAADTGHGTAPVAAAKLTSEYSIERQLLALSICQAAHMYSLSSIFAYIGFYVVDMGWIGDASEGSGYDEAVDQAGYGALAALDPTTVVLQPPSPAHKLRVWPSEVMIETHARSRRLHRVRSLIWSRCYVHAVGSGLGQDW